MRLWECEVFEGLTMSVARVIRAVQSAKWRRSQRWRVQRVEWRDVAMKLESRWLSDLRRPERERLVERSRRTAKARSGTGGRKGSSTS